MTHMFPEDTFVYCPGGSKPGFRVGVLRVLFNLFKFKKHNKTMAEHMLFCGVCGFASVFKLGSGWAISTFWKVLRKLLLHLTAFAPEYL